MAERDDPERSDEPSLELPSFGLRRKKRTPRGEERQQHEQPTPPPPPAPAAQTGTTLTERRARPRPRLPGPGLPRLGLPRLGLPRLGATAATLVTGLAVGLVTVGLVWASQAGCELVRGTSSCGKSGFVLLLAVLVAAGLLGGLLLKGFGVPEGGSTSFLAMSLVAVLLMLVLGDQLLAWWMVLAVPTVAMLAYVVAHRVTTAVVEPGGPELTR